MHNTASLVLFLAASMAVWHGVDYLEREVLTVPPFYRSWQPVRSLHDSVDDNANKRFVADSEANHDAQLRLVLHHLVDRHRIRPHIVTPHARRLSRYEGRSALFYLLGRLVS